MKKIKLTKNLKIVIAVIAAVAVVAVSVFASQPDLFEGWFRFRPRATTIPGIGAVYNYRNRIVSPVASPVTSVVVSRVTSRVTTRLTTGTVVSNVASSVASAVTSPVASAVNVPTKHLPSRSMGSMYPQLTSKILEKAARTDYLRNRAKYTLSNREKANIIKMYNKRYNLK